MPRIPLDQLTPGQVPAVPVVSRSGVVLLQAGSPLTEATIRRLASLGIESVNVKGGALSPEARAERAARIEARFAGHEQDPWMQALKAIVAGEALGEGAGPHA